MNTTKTHRIVPALAVALVLSALSALPAAARQEPGPDDRGRNRWGQTSQQCKLMRVGQQLVYCDNLTGNGVSAPLWIEEA
jgi:hypothetical protein